MKKVDNILKTFRKTAQKLRNASVEAQKEMEAKQNLASAALAARDEAAAEKNKADKVASKLENLLDDNIEDTTE